MFGQRSGISGSQVRAVAVALCGTSAVLTTNAVAAHPLLRPSSGSVDYATLRLRAEALVGELSEDVDFRQQFDSADRTVLVTTLPTSSGTALGGRFSVGAVADVSNFAAFLYGFGSYAKTERFEVVRPGALGVYPLHVSHHTWSAGLGAELELVRQIFLVGGQLGLGQGYSYVSLPSVEPGRHRTGIQDGLSLELSVGVKLPIRPVSAGVRLFGQTLLTAFQEPSWPLGLPLSFVGAGIFVDYDPFTVSGKER